MLFKPIAAKVSEVQMIVQGADNVIKNCSYEKNIFFLPSQDRHIFYQYVPANLSSP